MQESPFFFPNGAYKLFGILHRPSAITNGKGFVFCYPFAEERLWVQRVFVNFARVLAAAGYTVLRFDFMGHGDSSGNFEDLTVKTCRSDIHCSIGLLREICPDLHEIGLLGIRFGATLASVVASEREDIGKLILWEPVIDGSRYMKEILRVNLFTQTAVYKEIRKNRDDLIQDMKNGQTVNSDGYEISYELYQQACEINLLKKNPFPGKCLLVQMVESEENNYKKEYLDLYRKYNHATLLKAVEYSFWKEILNYRYRSESLFSCTIRWIEGEDG